MANLSNVIEQLRQNQIADDESTELVVSELRNVSFELTSIRTSFTENFHKIHEAILNQAESDVSDIMDRIAGDDAKDKRKEQKDKEDKREESSLLASFMSGIFSAIGALGKSLKTIVPTSISGALKSIGIGAILPLLGPLAGPLALLFGLMTGNSLIAGAGAVAIALGILADPEKRESIKSFGEDLYNAFYGDEEEKEAARAALRERVSFLFGSIGDFITESIDSIMGEGWTDSFREGLSKVVEPLLQFAKDHPVMAGVILGLSTFGLGLTNLSRLITMNPYVAGILALAAATYSAYNSATNPYGLQGASNQRISDEMEDLAAQHMAAAAAMDRGESVEGYDILSRTGILTDPALIEEFGRFESFSADDLRRAAEIYREKAQAARMAGAGAQFDDFGNLLQNGVPIQEIQGQLEDELEDAMNRISVVSRQISDMELRREPMNANLQRRYDQLLSEREQLINQVTSIQQNLATNNYSFNSQGVGSEDGVVYVTPS